MRSFIQLFLQGVPRGLGALVGATLASRMAKVGTTVTQVV